MSSTAAVSASDAGHAELQKNPMVDKIDATIRPLTGNKRAQKMLEDETKEILRRSARSRLRYARRAEEYRPSLDDIRSTPFMDYVREMLMGIPLDEKIKRMKETGIKLEKKDDAVEGSSGRETSSDLSLSAVANFHNNEEPANGDLSTHHKTGGLFGKNPNDLNLVPGMAVARVTPLSGLLEHGKDECDFIHPETAHHLSPDVSSVKEVGSSETPVQLQSSVDGSTYAAAKEFLQQDLSAVKKFESMPLPADCNIPAPPSDTPRLNNPCCRPEATSKEPYPAGTSKETITLGDLDGSSVCGPGHDPCKSCHSERPSGDANNEDTRIVADTADVRDDSSPSKNDGDDPYNTACPVKLSNGISKVTLPDGWRRDYLIDDDITGRGPLWDRGGELGEMMINTPIRQCVSGIGGVYEYTMLELPAMPVHKFRRKADTYRKENGVGSACDDDTSDDFMDDLARKFWRRLRPTMEAPLYGADMEGTLFNKDDDCHGWNLNSLDTCLNVLRADAIDGDKDGVVSLPGVTSSYIYFGMWASTFAAHTEDMNLLSVNYLHAGAPKYWYAIAEADAPRFESLAASHFNSAATSCKEFLRHKRYVISPPLLKKAGVSYTTQVQRPGDFIVTFPGSYHFGFNTGFNVAEATNFAVPEWTSLGFEAGICLCHPHSVRIDMERFLSLLRRCNIYRERYGYHLSYSDWAQMEAKRNLEIERVHNEKQTEKILSDASFENGKSSQANPVQLSETGTVVTIMTPSMLKKLRSNGSYNAGGVVETAANVQMRIALRAKPSQFLAKCKVLCIYACRDESSETAHDRRIIKKFFEGEITEIVEGHAKIRFLGKGRKNDAWLPLDGSALFLDEGYYQPDVTTPLGKE